MTPAEEVGSVGVRPLSREEPRGAESEHEMTVFLRVTRERTLWVDESELPYTF